MSQGWQHMAMRCHPLVLQTSMDNYRLLLLSDSLARLTPTNLKYGRIIRNRQTLRQSHKQRSDQ